MNTKIIAGILLIALGVLALVYQGIKYNKREEILNIGPIHATKETTKTIPLPPILGGLGIGGGIALVILGSKKP